MHATPWLSDGLSPVVQFQPTLSATARVSDLCQRLDDRGLLSPHSTGDEAGDGGFCWPTCAASAAAAEEAEAEATDPALARTRQTTMQPRI